MGGVFMQSRVEVELGRCCGFVVSYMVAICLPLRI